MVSQCVDIHGKLCNFTWIYTKIIWSQATLYINVIRILSFDVSIAVSKSQEEKYQKKQQLYKNNFLQFYLVGYQKRKQPTKDKEEEESYLLVFYNALISSLLWFLFEFFWMIWIVFVFSKIYTCMSKNFQVWGYYQNYRQGVKSMGGGVMYYIFLKYVDLTFWYEFLMIIIIDVFFFSLSLIESKKTQINILGMWIQEISIFILR